MVLRVTDRSDSVLRLDILIVNKYLLTKFEISPQQPQWSSGGYPNHRNVIAPI
jgi:hypothetical protein